MIRTKLTYANVVATLALIVAVAGGSTAIAISSKQKISGKLIKPGTITTKQLKDGSITGPKLARIDRVWVVGSSPNNSTKATCPQGSVLLGGGVAGSALNSVDQTAPSLDESWSGSSNGAFQVAAMCLRAGPGK